MSRPAFMQQRIDRQYRELRASDPDLFRQCVQCADGIGMNHRSLDKLADNEKLALLADIEQSIVAIAEVAASRSKQP